MLLAARGSDAAHIKTQQIGCTSEAIARAWPWEMSGTVRDRALKTRRSYDSGARATILPVEWLQICRGGIVSRPETMTRPATVVNSRAVTYASASAAPYCASNVARST
jgi:hypothetical protein